MKVIAYIIQFDMKFIHETCLLPVLLVEENVKLPITFLDGRDKHQPVVTPRYEVDETENQNTLTETIKICFRSYDRLTAVWIALSRISSLKHPHLAPMKPRYLCHNGSPVNDNRDSAYGGGVVYVSVEKGLRPLEKVVDLSLVQKDVEDSIFPRRLIDSMIAFIKGVEALHMNHLVHGQILPSGILVNAKGDVVLSGFLSGVLSLYQDSVTSEELLVWNSPEVILAMLSGDRAAVQQSKTPSSDMWNVGKISN